VRPRTSTRCRTLDGPNVATTFISGFVLKGTDAGNGEAVERDRGETGHGVERPPDILAALSFPAVNVTRLLCPPASQRPDVGPEAVRSIRAPASAPGHHAAMCHGQNEYRGTAI